MLQLIAADRIHDRLTIPKCRALRNEIRPDLNKKRAFNRQRWLSRHNRVMEQQHTEGKRQDWLAAILNLEQHLDILRAKISALGETETALLSQLASQSQHQKAA